MAVKKNRAAAPRTAPHAPSAPPPAVDAGDTPAGPDTAVQAALAANPGATVTAIAAAAGVSRAVAGRTLAALESDGRAARAGSPVTWQPVPPAEDAAGTGTPDGETPEQPGPRAAGAAEDGGDGDPAAEEDGDGAGPALTGPSSPDVTEPAHEDAAAEETAGSDAAAAANDGEDGLAASAGEAAGDAHPATGGLLAQVAAGDPAGPQPSADDAAGEAQKALAAQATEAAEKAHAATAAVLAALASGDTAAALTAADGARAAVAEARRAVKAAGAGHRAVPSARPGQLRDLVAGYLHDHLGEDFGPHQIGKALGRSSGAVANALDRLTELGDAEMASEQPRRYRSTRAAAPAGDPAAGGSGQPLAGAA